MTDRDAGYPMDHATARIVTELAAALLPHLKEAVSAEVAKAVSSLPSLGALAGDMAKTLAETQNSAARLSDALLPLTRACETVSAAAERMGGEKRAETAETNELLRVMETLKTLEKNLSEWGGILKANGRAQTLELTEFSAEVSEQVGWIKSAMPDVVREVLEKAAASRNLELRSVSEKNTQNLEMRLTRLEKIGKIILTGGMVLLALSAALFLK